MTFYTLDDSDSACILKEYNECVAAGVDILNDFLEISETTVESSTSKQQSSIESSIALNDISADGDKENMVKLFGKNSLHHWKFNSKKYLTKFDIEESYALSSNNSTNFIFTLKDGSGVSINVIMLTPLTSFPLILQTTVPNNLLLIKDCICAVVEFLSYFKSKGNWHVKFINQMNPILKEEGPTKVCIAEILLDIGFIDEKLFFQMLLPEFKKT
jgi:hypothetical protein